MAYFRIFVSTAIISLSITNCVVLATTTEDLGTTQRNTKELKQTDTSWLSIVPREIKILMNTCMTRSNAGFCLQRKFINFLDRAIMKDSISLTDGLSLDQSRETNTTDLVSTARQRGPFTDIIWDRLERFFNSRVLSVNLSQEVEEDVTEGRKKKKKEFAYYAVAVATAMALLIPLSLKGIALMAGTALMVAKVALVLAGLAALKHFVHHQGGDESHRRVHIEDLADAHTLAYSGYAAAQHAA